MWAPEHAGHCNSNVLLGLGIGMQLRSSRVVADLAGEQQFATADTLGRHVLGGKALVRQGLNGEWGQADRARVRRLIEHARTDPRERCRTGSNHSRFLPSVAI